MLLPPFISHIPDQMNPTPFLSAYTLRLDFKCQKTGMRLCLSLQGSVGWHLSIMVPSHCEWLRASLFKAAWSTHSLSGRPRYSYWNWPYFINKIPNWAQNISQVLSLAKIQIAFKVRRKSRIKELSPWPEVALSDSILKRLNTPRTCFLPSQNIFWVRGQQGKCGLNFISLMAEALP